MEIINNNPNSEGNRKKDVVIGRNMYLGLTLIAMGGVWLLRNLDVLNYRIFTILFSWQVLLIVLGGYFIAIRKWIPGIILMVVGIIFAIDRWFDFYLPIGSIILPTILIGAGIAITLQKK